MNAEIDPGRLSKSIAPANKLVDETRLTITESGVHLRAIDRANVGMVETRIGQAAFESFNASDLTVGINLNDLTTFVDIIKRSQKLNDDEDDTLSISIDTEKRRLHLEGGGQSFSLMLVDPDSIQQMPGVEDLSFSALAIIEQQWLKTHINAADELADYTTLDVDGSTITVEASSDISDYSGTLTEADNSTIKIDSAGAFRSCYSLKYLTDMVRPAPKTTPVTIRFAPETPLSMGFELAEGEVEVNYYLAPRVSNDDSTNAETEDLGDGQTDSTSAENVSTDSSATADD